jgi:hypothetical protein
LAIPVAAAGDDYEFPEDVAVPGQKDRFHPPVRLTAADGVIDSGKSWGHCGPWVEDVDGDGVRDLVVGDFSGFFLYFRNEGTNKEPKYAKSTRLQAGGEDAKVPIY